MSSAPVPVYARPFGVWSIVALWGLTHILLRALMSPVLGTDDMYENVLVQTLKPGYILRQPPLYEWLLWTVQQVTGPTIWSFLFLKYFLISVSALFLFLVARRAISDVRIAALCVFSYSLFYQFGWNLHEGVTHTVVLVTACSATAWTLIRALENRRAVDYALFGLAVGCGLLAKHSYPLFVLAVLGSALSFKDLRRSIRPALFALSLLVAALVYSPYLFWIVNGGGALIGEAASTMGVTRENAPFIVRALSGLGRLGFSLIGFSVPLVPLMGLIFWRRYKALVRPKGETTAALAPLNVTALFAGRTVLIMILITAVLIALTGANYVKERHMHPLLLLLPIFLFADLARFKWSEGFWKPARYLVVAIVVLASIAWIARVPGLVAPDRTLCGGKCRHMKPYADLEVPLRALGAPDAVLIGEDDYTAGNLRELFPHSLARVEFWPQSRQPERASWTPSGCFFVWEDGEKQPQVGAWERFARKYPDLAVQADQAREKLNKSTQSGAIAFAQYFPGEWPHLFKPKGWRTTWWGVVSLPSELNICRPVFPDNQGQAGGSD